MSPAPTASAALARSTGRVDRVRVLELLSELDDSDAHDTVAQLEELATDTEHITESESEGLASQSRAARALDEQLAGDLRHRRLGGETSSAQYLRELGDRPRLPAGVERRLIESAQAGDRRAREELVEAFLPL